MRLEHWTWNYGPLRVRLDVRPYPVRVLVDLDCGDGQRVTLWPGEVIYTAHPGDHTARSYADDVIAFLRKTADAIEAALQPGDVEPATAGGGGEG